MKYGRYEMDSKNVDVSMKKVMGASADASGQKDTTGGSIQTLGDYKVKNVPDVANKLSSANRSGFNGTTSPAPSYQ